MFFSLILMQEVKLGQYEVKASNGEKKEYVVKSEPIDIIIKLNN